jgi:hypothetical protein
MRKRALTKQTTVPVPDGLRAMYRRTLANWARDVLSAPPTLAWPGDDPEADYRDRDWRRLYAGSVLDD